MKTLLFATFFMTATLAQAQQPKPSPTPMTPAQAGLPSHFAIPPFTRLKIKVANPPREPLPGSPEASLPPGAPILVEATFTRDAKDVEIVYKWTGNRFTKAYQIESFTLYQNSLSDPNSVATFNKSHGLTFVFNEFSTLRDVDFKSVPGLYFYTPKSDVFEMKEGGKYAFKITEGAGAAQTIHNAPTEVVQVPKEMQPVLIVDQETLMPVRFYDRGVLYLFSYEKVPNFHVSPTGKFAEELKRLMEPPQY